MNTKDQALLSDLIQMVMVDGKIKLSEMEFIQKMASRMNISDKELVNLFENPHPSQTVYSEVERITHFYKLILVMKIDNETHETELVALKNFGLRMGIRPMVADQILKKMEQFKGEKLPADELLKIFKIYYN
ncbi:TerB family tellurite resistance protein [Aequorivita sp. F47161]|uniref:TerB family tellurite resistance protein n=1 Tax=Aequorivita vitellina TaxID=2874475 RepID=A0A9X1QZX5_9FLAO|nr:TerB family tellurite resistance protein [Aequorivita vitellina]MCG2419639.1 TerB family tellurite resistance protein [Aequorivita vitellina]